MKSFLAAVPLLFAPLSVTADVSAGNVEVVKQCVLVADYFRDVSMAVVYSKSKDEMLQKFHDLDAGIAREYKLFMMIAGTNASLAAPDSNELTALGLSAVDCYLEAGCDKKALVDAYFERAKLLERACRADYHGTE